MAERSGGNPNFIRRTAVETIQWFGDRGKNTATVLVPAAFFIPTLVTPAIIAAIGVFGDEIFHPFDGDRAVEKRRLFNHGYKDNFIDRMKLSWNPRVLWPWGTAK